MDAFTQTALPICNPTGERSATVVEIWHEAVDGYEPPVDLDAGGGVTAQLDHVDKDDPQRSEIVLRFDKIAGGDSHYGKKTCEVTLTARKSRHSGPRDRTVAVFPNGVRFENRRMHVYFELKPQPWKDYRTFMAGSATNVEVYGTAQRPDGKEEKFIEFLDANAGLWGFAHHDGEKRAMQIASICLPRPATDPLAPHAEHTLFDKPYKVWAHGNGPVRSWVTLRSSSFDYTFHEPLTGTSRTLTCHLYRVISLWEADATYLTEELFVRTKVADDARPVDLAFSPRYFMSADLGPRRGKIVHYPAVPDWFSIHCDAEPKPGYGFATDVHARHVWNPPIGFPRPYKPHLAYSWELGFSHRAHCLHLFRLNTTAEEMERLAGHYWYTHIYKPLRLPIPARSSGGPQ
jgi:hypothetical protein